MIYKTKSDDLRALFDNIAGAFSDNENILDSIDVGFHNGEYIAEVAYTQKLIGKLRNIKRSNLHSNAHLISSYLLDEIIRELEKK